MPLPGQTVTITKPNGYMLYPRGSEFLQRSGRRLTPLDRGEDVTARVLQTTPRGTTVECLDESLKGVRLFLPSEAAACMTVQA